jgi:hypothetical protein
MAISASSTIVRFDDLGEEFCVWCHFFAACTGNVGIMPQNGSCASLARGGRASWPKAGNSRRFWLRMKRDEARHLLVRGRPMLVGVRSSRDVACCSRQLCSSSCRNCAQNIVRRQGTAVNSPTSSTITAFSTFVNTRGLISI